MALAHDAAAAEAGPTEGSWLFAAAAAGQDEAGREAEPAHNRGKVIAGLVLLLAIGIGAVGLVLVLAPWANAFGGCGGG